METNQTAAVSRRDGRVARLVCEYLVDEVDEAIHGVTFDGRRIVVAAGKRLARLMPDNGRPVDQFETFPERGGLAFDGRDLWQFSNGQLQRLDPRTGFVQRSFVPRVGEVTGLECTDHEVLVLCEGGRSLARLETLDGARVAGVDLGATAALHGLAWIGDSLWTSRGGELGRIDLPAGRIVDCIALPAGLEVVDLASDADGRVWCVDGRSRYVRAYVA